MERAIFWIIVVVLGLLAATFLSLWWAVSAAIPIVFIAWWAAYLSSWARRRMQVDDGSSASRRSGRDAA